jgi:hypothetical protein
MPRGCSDQANKASAGDGKSDATGAGGTTISSTKYSREDGMIRRVLSVMAVVSTKSPFAILANHDDFKNYVAILDPKHRIPHHLTTWPLGV